MEEFKPMDIGSIIDKMFKMILNKEFFSIFTIYSSIYFLLGFFLFFIIYFINKVKLSILLVLLIILISILFIFVFFIYSYISTDFFINKFLIKEWKIKKSLISSFKKIIYIFLYYLYITLILGILVLLNLALIGAFSKSDVINIISKNMPFISDGFISFIFIIIEILSFLFCYFLFFSLLSLSIPIIAYEKKINPFGYSIKLVKKNLWNIFGSFLLLFLIGAFIYLLALLLFIIALGLIFTIIEYYGIKYNEIIIAYIIYFIMIFLYFIITMPLTAFNVLLFFNQKIKHEGLDIELLVETMIERKQ